MIALIHKTRLIPIIVIIKNVAININWRRRIFSSKIVFSLYSHTLISSKKCSFKIKIYMLSKHIFSSFLWIWKVRIKWTRRKKLDEVQLTKNVWKDSFFEELSRPHFKTRFIDKKAFCRFNLSHKKHCTWIRVLFSKD